MKLVGRSRHSQGRGSVFDQAALAPSLKPPFSGPRLPAVANLPPGKAGSPIARPPGVGGRKLPLH